MKIDHYARNVMTSGTEATDFVAEMNGVAFSILSDGIYQHKIPAIIREIACNAYDAHVEAGRADVPFSIQLPNEFDPNFTVEDTGTGLDDDGVRKVFAAYFKSSKTGSNDVTGGMGIGAKSMFSYSESFMICARKNGKERRYAAYIGESGVPQVKLLSEVITDMRDGVKVQMPVQPNDFGKFETETRVIASMFKTLPEVKGGTGRFEYLTTDIYEQIEKDGFARIDVHTGSELYSHESFYVLMGNVIYPVASHNVLSEIDPFLTIARRDSSGEKAFVVPFNIGELAPTASRESISLKQNAIDLIVERTNAVLKKEKAKVDAVLDTFDHPTEAVLYLLDRFGRSESLSHFTYKGKSMRKIAKRFYATPYGGVTYRLTPKMYGFGYRSSNIGDGLDQMVVAETSRPLVGFYREKSDAKTTFASLVRKYCNAGGVRSGTNYVTFPKPLSKSQRNRIETFYGREVKWVSFAKVKEAMKSDPKVRNAYTDRGEKSTNTIYCKTITTRGDVRKVFHVEIDPEQSYAYIDNDELEGWYLRPSEIESGMTYLVRNANNEKQMATFGIPHWKELALEKASGLEEAFDLRRTRHLFDMNRSSTPIPHDDIVNMAMDHSVHAEDIRALVDEFDVKRSQCDMLSSAMFEFIINHSGVDVPDTPLFEKVNSLFNSIAEKYLIVGRLGYGAVHKDKTAIMQMIDFCEKNGFTFPPEDSDEE